MVFKVPSNPNHSMMLLLEETVILSIQSWRSVSSLPMWPENFVDVPRSFFLITGLSLSKKGSQTLQILVEITSGHL